MRIVVQRVSSASVLVEDDVVGAIGRGLCLLVGVGEGDAEGDARAAADKIAQLRVFPDEKGRMNRSVVDVGGDVLVVSQFTLLADVRRGRRPSFTAAADPELATSIIDELVASLQGAGLRTEEGSFGAKMDVELVNEGPVTFVIDVRQGSVS